jgi:Ca2+-binding RTX toxin-like protein
MRMITKRVGGLLRSSSSSVNRVRRAAIEALEQRAMMSATWQVQSDYFGTRDGVSEPRSLRGLALSADDAHLYGGFIQGTDSAAIREVSSGINSSLIGNDGGSPTNSYGANPSYTTGLQAKVTTFKTAKGLATDDRGNVYATLNSGANATIQNWVIYNSALAAQVSPTIVSTGPSSQLNGIAAAKIGGNYFVYVGWKAGQIERWNVNNAANPVLDTAWGASGKITLKSINANAYLDGLEVDTDGTIYVAGGLQSATSFGDSLIKIPAAAAASGNVTSATTSHVDVKGGANGLGGFGAMDVALFGGRAYVTEYLQTNSTIAVFNTSDLSSAGIITPPDTTLAGPSGKVSAYNSDAGTDSGFSGIDISADGKIFVAEQLYNFVPAAGTYTPPGGVLMTGTRIYFDRVLVSSALDNTGPVTANAAVNPNAVFNGASGTMTVTANVDDSSAGGFFIKSAEFSVDHGAHWTAMSASDGAFDLEMSEDVTGSFTLASAGITAAGNYDVWVRGADTAGNVGAYQSIAFTVMNGAPTANAGGPYDANEGGTVALDGTGSSDPGNSALTYAWDLDGDNIFGETGANASHGDEVGAHPVYQVGDLNGPDTATVKLHVTNIYSLTSPDTSATINLHNTAPTASMSNNGPVLEGSPVNASFVNPTDPSAADLAAGLHYSFALSTADLAGSYTAATDGISKAFTFADNGTYTIFGRVVDQDNDFSDYSTIVTVNNANPTATLGNNGPVNEGTPATVSFSGAFDPSSADTAAGLHYTYATSIAGLATTYSGATDGASKAFTFPDNGSYTVYGRVFDKDGGSTQYSTAVTVNDVAPVAAISAPTPASPAAQAPVSFTVSATDVASDVAIGFKYVINWGDATSTTISPSANNSTVANVSHTFAGPGSYTVSVVATDKDNVSSVAATRTVVVGLPASGATGTDPWAPSLKALFIVGTSNNDAIDITPTPTVGTLKVKVNGITTTYAGITGHVFAWGLAGNDNIHIDDNLPNPVAFFGGAGDDHLEAKAKSTSTNNVLIGGDGKDSLAGGAGQDILIGGLGADQLNAAKHNDLLIAGATSYDDSLQKLLDIQKEWTSTNTYANKTAHLLGQPGTAGSTMFNGTTYIRPGIEVFGDNVKDVLDGGTDNAAGALDLYFAATSGTYKDDLKNLGAGETVISIT